MIINVYHYSHIDHTFCVAIFSYETGWAGTTRSSIFVYTCSTIRTWIFGTSVWYVIVSSFWLVLQYFFLNLSSLISFVKFTELFTWAFLVDAVLDSIGETFTCSSVLFLNEFSSNVFSQTVTTCLIALSFLPWTPLTICRCKKKNDIE